MQKEKLETIGELYYVFRSQLMLKTFMGLTKIYNAFHAQDLKPNITSEVLQKLDKKAIENRFGKEVWSLWNYLQKNPRSCCFDEVITAISKLRELHILLDNTVLEAYGWQDIQLKHDFYELDYLSENDSTRFTIHPDARKEILKRLLELNHKIYWEEVAAGFWNKKSPKDINYKKYDSISLQVKENDQGYGYGGLFDL